MVMPAVFFGHGSPMNALDHNGYTRAWRSFGASVPRPRAILCVSAHWFINATAVLVDGYACGSLSMMAYTLGGQPTHDPEASTTSAALPEPSVVARRAPTPDRRAAGGDAP